MYILLKYTKHQNWQNQNNKNYSLGENGMTGWFEVTERQQLLQ